MVVRLDGSPAEVLHPAAAEILAPAPTVGPPPEPEPEPEPAPEPDLEPAASRPPAKPRKRPAPPTNKDLLKQTLTLLAKVDRRLDHLEQEMVEIDETVRRVVAAGTEDRPV